MKTKFLFVLIAFMIGGWATSKWLNSGDLYYGPDDFIFQSSPRSLVQIFSNQSIDEPITRNTKGSVIGL